MQELGSGHMSEAGTGASGGRLIVDLDAIAANFLALCRIAAPAEVAGVVKADAYGLGAGRVGRRLLREGCRTFFVATLDEAIALRGQLGPGPAILVLNGFVPGTGAAYATHSLTPVLNTLSQALAWAEADGAPGAALQVDTGMSRLGLSVTEQTQLLATPGLLERLKPALLMSHLAAADDPSHVGNTQQYAAFTAARARFPGIRTSLANSAGIFLGTQYHHDLERPGAALYGIDIGPNSHDIVPTITLDARIIQVRHIPAGEGVGYGFTFHAEKPMRLATIGIGYADGWPRSLSNSGAAWSGAARLPIIGRVSMDSFSIDITNAPDSLGEGDFVELIGSHQSADAVAQAAGTIGYEILTRLGRRFDRLYREATRT